MFLRENNADQQNFMISENIELSKTIMHYEIYYGISQTHLTGQHSFINVVMSCVL